MEGNSSRYWFTAQLAKHVTRTVISVLFLVYFKLNIFIISQMMRI